MSVAFRRDGDEEHLEPKFELPIPPGPNLVTARGLALVRAKAGEWEAVVLSLTDEAEVKAARRQLRYWRTREATAQLVAAPDGKTAEFGCTIALRMNGKPRSIAIVGDDEADPAAGLLSFAAPLCRAIMHAEPGDLLDFGGKSEAIEIVAITAAG